MNRITLRELIKNAFAEDLGIDGDISTDSIFAEDHVSEGIFVAKDSGIICGLDVLTSLYSIFDNEIEFKTGKNDGDGFIKGDIIAEVKGRTRSLLTCERTALNLLQHMSGIATKTRLLASKLPEGVRIADTRKTLPGLRMLQKYAVRVGGGVNHRMGLYDMVMLKENHITASGGIINAVRKVRDHIGHTKKIEIEAENVSQVKECVAAGADIIMLDNMDYNSMKECCMIIGNDAVIEVSGNITETNISERIADLPVHIVSCGALTHTVKAADISFLLK